MEIVLPEIRDAVTFFRIKSENRDWLNARAAQESQSRGQKISAALLLDKYLDELRKEHPPVPREFFSVAPDEDDTPKKGKRSAKKGKN